MPRLMKGKHWEDYKHKVVYPLRGEIKCDEIRCHVIVGALGVQFLSYAEKPLANMERFAASFSELARLTGYTEFDCGFEVNGNFNDSYRWVRSTKKLPDDLVQSKQKFMLYDLPELQGVRYCARLLRIDEVIECASAYIALNLTALYSTPLHSEADVEEFFANMRAAGHEGIMLKTYDHLYECGKRTNTWLKYKPENDADGIVTKVNMAYATVANEMLGIAVGDPLNRAGSVTVRMEDGSEADAHGIRHDLARDMIDNPHLYIGQWAEIKYMERDRQGGYRHPVFYRLREAKA